MATEAAEMELVEADLAAEAVDLGPEAAVARQAEARRARVAVGTAAVAQLAAWVVAPGSKVGSEVKVVQVEAKAAATPSP